MSYAGASLDPLLTELGLSRSDSGGSVRILGDDPVVGGPHRLGAASAVALAAHGTAVAAIWRQRGGRGQDVTIDIVEAVHGLNTGQFVRQNGYAIDSMVLMASPTYGLHPTADERQVLTVTMPLRQREGILNLLGCGHSFDAVRAKLAAWNSVEFEDACGERGLAGCMVRTVEEWNQHPQAQWLASKPVIDIRKIGESAPEPFSPGERPLSGMRVLNVAHVLAGPILCRTLASQGADVLRITSHLVPDDFPVILDTGFGQRSAYLHLDYPEDRTRLEALIREADIFVQSYSPGSLAKRGFSPERIAELRPGIIYAEVSCYGGGPWAARAGYDPNAQAVTGISVTEGSLADPRSVPTGLLADLTTSYLGAAGVLTALLRRAKSGGSYQVRLSLTRTCMWAQSIGLIEPERRLPSDHPLPLPTPTLLKMHSSFGELTYMAPPARFSRTPAYWTQPPEPPGASRPEWLPR